jgi:hypothetical protein
MSTLFLEDLQHRAQVQATFLQALSEFLELASEEDLAFLGQTLQLWNANDLDGAPAVAAMAVITDAAGFKADQPINKSHVDALVELVQRAANLSAAEILELAESIDEPRKGLWKTSFEDEAHEAPGQVWRTLRFSRKERGEISEEDVQGLRNLLVRLEARVPLQAAESVQEDSAT